MTGAAVAGAPFISTGRCQLFGQSSYSVRTIDLVGRSTVVDMLGLLTLDWQKLENWQTNPQEFTAADLRKLRESGITVFHPAVDVNSPDSYATTLKWMTSWSSFVAHHSRHFLRVERAEDLARAKQEGRIGIILGLQNSDHFRSLEDVQTFYQLGQRISQLTYNEHNQLGTGCTEAKDDGLTAFGADVVKEMNRLGMAIDISHSGDRTSLDAISLSKKPVMITHANCRALVPTHPRCKSDEVIRRVAASGGVMGMTHIRSFVRAAEPTTIEHALDHFDYAAKLVGVEHIGVGSDTDLDGRDRGLPPRSRLRMDISGLNHPKRMFDLTEGLVRRGYTDRHIESILGGNCQRALSEIWAT